MPRMEFPSDADQRIWPGYILSYMLFPNDADKRGQLRTQLRDEHFKKWDTQVLGKYWDDDATACRINDALRNGPIDADIAKRQKQGIVAGELLLLILALEKEGLGGSYGQAKAIIEASDSFTTVEGKNIPSSDQNVRKAWKGFCTVSHLWAAFVSFNEYFPEGPDFPLEVPQDFFALSECFAIRALFINPLNKKRSRIFQDPEVKTVFPDPDLWRPPESYYFEEIFVEAPCLTDKARDVVLVYRAAERLAHK